jgi:predicted pyridoxine 5'-phosphate oxidase superfamily flavin-nucleotide-binding protein
LTDFAACDLASIYPNPSPRVIAKARPEIDVHAKKFIGMSPFCVLATSGSDGSVTPRSGAIPLHPAAGQTCDAGPFGNNRIDSFRTSSKVRAVQLIFFCPGSTRRCASAARVRCR